MSLVTATRYCAWVSLLVLLLQQGTQLWAGGAPPVIWVKLLPLVMFMPGMRKDKLRSYIWLCFVCLLYFMMLVVDLFAHPGTPSPIIGTTAVVLLFVSAMLYVRWRARELRQAAAQATGHGD